MDRLLSFTLTISFLLVGFLGFVAAAAETSGAVDCESIYLNVPSSEIPLTKREEIELMGKVYFSEVSRLPRCEEPKTATSGGGASGGGASDGGASDGGASDGSRLNIPSFSVNNIQENGTSIPIANAAVQSATSITDQAGKEKVTEVSSSGKEHEPLKATNNKAAIRKQVKEAADAETDPAIKAELMEHYEALK